ncbi:MAG: cell wall-binding repeat-containing protein [Actinomycetaceae bacterium]|nr:cell wall-binding repeat-containing protein [Actinomycetaceae bacterium]MDY6082338.1 cell wall-binding repeat-containing protein [Actinomycetaceae bacterium]
MTKRHTAGIVATVVALVASLGMTTLSVDAQSSTGTASGYTSGAPVDVHAYLNAQRSVTYSVPSTAKQASTTTMPENPSFDVPPDVDSAIPDDAQLVSEDYATLDDGTLKDVQTGNVVTDSSLVGTTEQPPDPREKTHGKSFIPVSVADVREAIPASTRNATFTTNSHNPQNSHATNLALQPNSRGAHWGTYNGMPAFFEKSGSLFALQAHGVVDVSKYQGTIDWAKAKAAGVEGAIVRIGYGDETVDPQAKRNISELKRLHIPFGIYLYSYAYDSAFAAKEGTFVVKTLKSFGVTPSDLSYPVVYDLEQWTWRGHKVPSSTRIYDGIVNAWFGKLRAAGFSDLSVYSYRAYLDSALNSPNIRSKTRWVAAYSDHVGFPFYTNDRGWQYSSNGRVAGINADVDLNAFGYRQPVTLAGQDRTRTSILIAQFAFPQGADTVYLARSDVYADALAAGALTDGPIILVTQAASSRTAAAAYVKNAHPHTVIALGGKDAVSDATLKSVAGSTPKTRITGSNRYATSANIAQRVKQLNPRMNRIYLAEASEGVDALAAGSLTDGPVLLVPRSGSLPTQTAAAIAAIKPSKVVALGNTGAVSNSILSQAAKGRQQGRIGGSNRYATAIAIAKEQFAQGSTFVYLASGKNPVDAIAGGVLKNGPILLVPNALGNKLDASVGAEIRRLGATTVMPLGGTKVISDAIRRDAITRYVR